MLAKVNRVLQAINVLTIHSKEPVTIGEVSRATKIPYTSVKRYLSRAIKSDLVHCEILPYKSTGKVVYYLTDRGFIWVGGYRSMF